MKSTPPGLETSVRRIDAAAAGTALPAARPLRITTAAIAAKNANVTMRRRIR
jgi:hypothetical protein